MLRASGGFVFCTSYSSCSWGSDSDKDTVIYVPYSLIYVPFSSHMCHFRSTAETGARERRLRLLHVQLLSSRSRFSCPPSPSPLPPSRYVSLSLPLSRSLSFALVFAVGFGGLVFMVWGLGFGVWGLGWKVQGEGFGVQTLPSILKWVSHNLVTKRGVQDPQRETFKGEKRCESPHPESAWMTDAMSSRVHDHGILRNLMGLDT